MSGKTGKAEKAQKSIPYFISTSITEINAPINTETITTAADSCSCNRFCIDGRIDLCDRCTDEIRD